MLLRSLITATAVLFSLNSWAADSVTLTKDNTVVMNQVFDTDTVAKVAAKAKEMDSLLPSNEPLYLVINSPGGSIDAGIELIENLNNLNRPVHTISLFSASMGFQTVQGVKGKRYVVKSGTLMSHRARGAFGGEFPGQLDNRYNYYLKRVLALDANVVSRTNGKHTMKTYADLIRDEFWCDGKDCVEAGFADAVIAPVCDGSLAGTSKEIERFSFLGIPIELTMVIAKCPTVTGILDFSISIGGESLFTPTKDLTYNSRVEKLTKDEITGLNTKVQAIITNRTSKINNIQKY